MSDTSAVVKRYTADWHQDFRSIVTAFMRPNESGHYVKYDDYAALQARVDELEAQSETAFYHMQFLMQKWHVETCHRNDVSCLQEILDFMEAQHDTEAALTEMLEQDEKDGLL